MIHNSSKQKSRFEQLFSKKNQGFDKLAHCVQILRALGKKAPLMMQLITRSAIAVRVLSMALLHVIRR
jgi:hypothetical protein